MSNEWQRRWSDDDRERSLAASMNRDKEHWAEALAVERQHGDGAPQFIAERIGELALAGDMNGVLRWREIAIRLDQIQRSASKPPS